MRSATVPSYFAVMLFLVCSSQASADLHFTDPLADAGEVHTGNALAHHFKFLNDGPETAEIIETRASCGCLTPRLKQQVYKPGEEGDLILEVNTLSQTSGPHTWRVTLYYQCGSTHYEMPLQLTASLIREVSVQPAALVVYADRAITHEITLTDLRAQPLKIADVRASSPNLKPVVVGKSLDASGHQICRISLHVTDAYAEGRHDEVVGIYTDDPAYPEIKVPVTVIKRARQRFSAMPREVNLAADAGRAVPSRIVLISDQENQPVVLDSVVPDDPAVVCQWAQGPGAMSTVRINVDRAHVHGDILKTTVHVHISKPAPGTLTIPVSCLLR